MGYGYNYSKGRSRNLIPRILHQQGIARCGNKIPKIEKWVLALVMADWKLRLYFQVYLIIVMTS